MNMIFGAAAVRHHNASSSRHAYQECMDHMGENELEGAILSERRRSTRFDARRGLLIGKSRRRLRIAHIEVGSRTTDEHASACIAFVCWRPLPAGAAAELLEYVATVEAKDH